MSMKLWSLKTSSKCKTSKSCRREKDKVNLKRSLEAKVSKLKCRESTKMALLRFCKLQEIPHLRVKMRGWALETTLKMKKIRESRKRSKNSKRTRREFKDRKTNCRGKSSNIVIL